MKYFIITVLFFLSCEKDSHKITSNDDDVFVPTIITSTNSLQLNWYETYGSVVNFPVLGKLNDSKSLAVTIFEKDENKQLGLSLRYLTNDTTTIDFGYNVSFGKYQFDRYKSNAYTQYLYQFDDTKADFTLFEEPVLFSAQNSKNIYNMQQNISLRQVKPSQKILTIPEKDKDYKLEFNEEVNGKYLIIGFYIETETESAFFNIQTDEISNIFTIPNYTINDLHDFIDNHQDLLTSGGTLNFYSIVEGFEVDQITTEIRSPEETLSVPVQIHSIFSTQITQ